MISIINQSKYAQITDELMSEIEEQVLNLGDAFSGPVVIRDVPNHEGRYFVVSCGQVWSTGHGTRFSDRIQHRIGSSRPNGYIHVCFHCDNHCREDLYVHEVIAKTFIINSDSLYKTDVNHKDEIPGHDYVVFEFRSDDLILNEEKSNLEWLSHKDNICYGTCRDRISVSKSRIPLGVSRHSDLKEYNRRLAKIRYSRIWSNGVSTLPYTTLSNWIQRGIIQKNDWKPTNKYVIRFKEDWTTDVISYLRSLGFEVTT